MAKDVASIKEALAKYINQEDLDKCWNWTGAVSSSGYGSHRYIWKRINPDIDLTGLTLDHFKFPIACVGKLCVNPNHLRPATQRENNLRGDTLSAKELSQTHCIRGHEFTETNTHLYPSGSRACRTCRRAYDKKRANSPARKETMRKAKSKYYFKRKAGEAKNV